MDYFLNSDGKKILTRIIGAIQENKEYLSEIDGRIGDGDHGINMNKGFSIFEERIRDRDVAFSDGLGELGEILLTEIGGSMGPIYGTIFCGMAERADFHIGLMTGTVSAAEDSLRGAESLINRYGSVENGGMILHYSDRKSVV